MQKKPCDITKTLYMCHNSRISIELAVARIVFVNKNICLHKKYFAHVIIIYFGVTLLLLVSKR